MSRLNSSSVITEGVSRAGSWTPSRARCSRARAWAVSRCRAGSRGAEVVMEEALVVASSPDHRLAGRRVRDPAVLAGERWVTFPPQRRRREPFATVLEQRLNAAGIEAGRSSGSTA